MDARTDMHSMYRASDIHTIGNVANDAITDFDETAMCWPS